LPQSVQRRPAASTGRRLVRKTRLPARFSRNWRLSAGDSASFRILWPICSFAAMEKKGTCRRFSSAAISIASQQGGRYDGALGTLAAFEVLETLEDAGIERMCRLKWSRGPTRKAAGLHPEPWAPWHFRSGISPKVGRTLSGTDGVLWRDALAATLAALPVAEHRGPRISDFGLSRTPHRAGTFAGKGKYPHRHRHWRVQGTRWLEITITGQAAHAGTTQLAFRRDPMIAVTRLCTACTRPSCPQDENARFTVGRIAAHPGSVNAIPGSVSLSVDLRHPDAGRLDISEATILEAFQASAAATWL
jgi:N-carbamoyl-L-amino-acid hydrolase